MQTLPESSHPVSVDVEKRQSKGDQEKEADAQKGQNIFGKDDLADRQRIRSLKLVKMGDVILFHGKLQHGSSKKRQNESAGEGENIFRPEHGYHHNQHDNT